MELFNWMPDFDKFFELAASNMVTGLVAIISLITVVTIMKRYSKNRKDTDGNPLPAREMSKPMAVLSLLILAIFIGSSILFVFGICYDIL